jgi:hypothetical protein
VLSIADMDDRTQPDFGKAKIRVLAEWPYLSVVFHPPRPRLSSRLGIETVCQDGRGMSGETNGESSARTTPAAFGEGHPEEKSHGLNLLYRGGCPYEVVIGSSDRYA